MTVNTPEIKERGFLGMTFHGTDSQRKQVVLFQNWFK